MKFNEHWDLQGKHAFLSPSQYHWVNYDREKLADRYFSYDAAARGTRLHALASECIKLNVKLSHSKKAICQFVNDAIGYKMDSEVTLYYSEFCFGTADAISFRKNFLRIHDLKTGTTPASMIQLEIYAALFCLEYDFNPQDIKIELRLYQSDEVAIYEPPAANIAEIMETIKEFDKYLKELSLD